MYTCYSAKQFQQNSLLTVMVKQRFYTETEEYILLEPRKVNDQLNKVLLSHEFKATVRQKKFLTYIIEMFLADRGEEIKGYSVATEVFGRKSFDQTKDPIVSIEARRLRRALESYYDSAGINDEIQITIPKGSYVPLVKPKEKGVAPHHTPKAIHRRILYDQSRPTVLIRPLKCLSNSDNTIYIAEGFKSELSVELARYQDIQVLVKPSGQNAALIAEPNARFVIEGSVRSDSKKLKLVIHLLDQKNSRLLWAESYSLNLTNGDVITFQEEIASNISSTIAEEQGFICQTISKESKYKPPAELKTYEAILKFYMYEATFSADSFYSAYDALERAVTVEPDCSRAWSSLGRLHSTNYCTEFYDKDTSVEKAVEYSEKAVRLNPSDQRIRAGLALAYLQNNQISEGRLEVRKAIELNPRSSSYFDVIGHVMALLGDWDSGTALLHKSIKVNPYHRPYIYHILFLDWLLKEDYENAYLETLNFTLTPVFCAVASAELGNLAEAKAAIDSLLALKPDFSTRGKVLMQRMVKSEKIINVLLKGLEKAGLEVC